MVQRRHLQTLFHGFFFILSASFIILTLYLVHQVDNARIVRVRKAFKPPKMKIVGFSDITYVPVAARWYNDLSKLGYTEHVIVATDIEAYKKLQELNVRAEFPFTATTNFDIWAKRIQYSIQEIENGVSLLVSDVDLIFMSHYVPLIVFQNSGYDVLHTYGLNHPENILRKSGFVVCGCFTWYTATVRTLSYLKLLNEKCQQGCDDQVAINEFLNDNVIWETNKLSIKRIRSYIRKFNRMFVTGMVGRCNLTGHTIKIWDRDFVWRGPILPDTCPPNHTWVAIPAGSIPSEEEKGDRSSRRMQRREFWEQGKCGQRKGDKLS